LSARRRFAASAACAAALVAASGAAAAASLRACEQPAEFSAAQKDVILRFAAVVKQQLAASGAPVALVARSGMDLHRLQVRYSHEGVALGEAGSGAWTVRELYYACDERRPRIYDEGLAGFLLGTDDPRTGWISIVLLPPAPARALARTATDKRHALGVLGVTYSANAYPFSTRFQNCNQWVMELLADAWNPEGDAPPPDAPAAGPGDSSAARARAQRWLRAQGYLPTVFTVSARPMTWLADVVPWMSNADHPPEEIAHGRYAVSMPASIETFVRATVPGATRLEVCHVGPRVVVHRGWDEIAEGCVAGPGDETIELATD
jgi:hypothetical protein